jgi:hypothetical protein
MQMNIPAMFGPICFSGSLEEDWNAYGRTTDTKWWQNCHEWSLQAANQVLFGPIENPRWPPAVDMS